jgi:hypothetical protein
MKFFIPGSATNKMVLWLCYTTHLLLYLSNFVLLMYLRIMSIWKFFPHRNTETFFHRNQLYISTQLLLFHKSTLWILLSKIGVFTFSGCIYFVPNYDLSYSPNQCWYQTSLATILKSFIFEPSLISMPVFFPHNYMHNVIGIQLLS